MNPKPSFVRKNNIMLTHLLILLSGLISGFILFQSAINAPLIFKTLELEHARPLLRSIFPVLFKVVAVLAIAMLLVAWFAGVSQVALLLCGLSVLLPTVCALLVPATNRAADEGRQNDFKRLHTVSVVFTLAVLIINLALPFTM